MKRLRQHTILCSLNGRSGEAFVEEYKTLYSVTIKIWGAEFPCAADWRYPKKQYPAVTDAVRAALRDLKN